jgi:hypothetical protein
VASAIAEYPGARIGYLFFSRLQIEGEASAFDGGLPPPLVQQGLAEPAVKAGDFRLCNFLLRDIATAGLAQANTGNLCECGLAQRLFAAIVEIAH